ncbi:xanthine dehydrogenase family protein molybdopterin-binding subunit [Variovorax robiniae]|uniref:Xanthine dehydrogenase family protein molybdopterin-binding subunit n=1 Tax=Variovorax robiniae TaxID=1836199 RepID=A0ABU8XH99_9BURK
MSMQGMKQLQWIGRSIPKVEDRKFLMGQGGYVDDLDLPNMLHVAVVRSPVAHARILSFDTSRALELDGVVAVITGKQAAELCDFMPDFNPEPNLHKWRVLADEKVRFVGEGVAVVVARSRYIAEDARELVDVEYEPLPVVPNARAAMLPGSALLHEKMESNVALDSTLSFGDVDGEFARADIVVRETIRWGRTSAQPLETVGAVANFNTATGMLTINSNSVALTNFAFLVAGTLKVQSNKLDLIPMPAGGSFGAKFWAVRVAITAGMCSKFLGKPVKYVEDRLDHAVSCDHHGSEREYEIELAMTKEGEFRAIKFDIIDDYGAYFQFGLGTHGNAMSQVIGPYNIKAVSYRARGVLSNKCQQGAYRGFGSEVHNFAMERIVDKAVREHGFDRIELRRSNFIQPSQFPFKIPGGNVYDSGDYEGVLREALGLGKLDHWRAEQTKGRAEGRYIGIGVTTCQERSVYAANEWWFFRRSPAMGVSSVPESISLSVDALGAVSATLYSTAFWGNSPETVVAQVLGEELGVNPDDVSFSYAGTAKGLPASGPGGSRFTVMISGAVQGAAAKIRAKALKVAAHMMEISENDLEYVNGGVQVKGDAGKRLGLAEIAIMPRLFKHQLPDDIDSGFEADMVFDHPYTTLPTADRSDLGVYYPMMAHAAHIAVVEVDVQTGAISFLDYVAVHDCGTVVNPRSLDGHVIGGLAQGVGQTLLEEYVYDEEGQIQSSSLMDYLIPSAMEVPEVRLGHHETPSPFTPYGMKGGGEGGRMHAPGAIASAVDDALAPLGAKRATYLPLTPERVLNLIAER